MKTYDEILKGMVDSYERRTVNPLDRSSDIFVRMQVLAGEVYSAQTEIEWLKNQMFPQTATGKYLDMHAEVRGLSRKQGTKAFGDATLFVERLLHYDIEIPKGTIFASSGESSFRFVCTEDCVLTSGHLATNVPVEALVIGKAGNLAELTMTVLVTPIPGIVRVTNEFALEGGTDVESDDSLRKRLLESYIDIPNGTNKAFYIKSAMEVDGVTAAGVVAGKRGLGTVDVMIASDEAETPQELINKVQAHLNTVREINVDILVKPLTRFNVNISAYIGVKKGYDFSEVQGRCVAEIERYFKTLNAGETVYLSAVGEYLTHVDGVENYSYLKNQSSDVPVDDDSIAVPGKILIMERV